MFAVLRAKCVRSEAVVVPIAKARRAAIMVAVAPAEHAILTSTVLLENVIAKIGAIRVAAHLMMSAFLPAAARLPATARCVGVMDAGDHVVRARLATIACSVRASV